MKLPGTFVALSVAIVGAMAAAFYFLKPRIDEPENPMIGMLVKKGDMVSVNAPGGPAWGNLDGPITALVYEAPPGQPTIGVVPHDNRIPPVPTNIERNRVLKILVAPAPTAPAGSVAYLGDPMQLRHGRTYRSRIELTGLEAKFASAGDISKELTSQGFAGVTATKTAPAGWPADAVANPGAGTWFAEGIWQGSDQSVEKPKQIQKAWEA